MDIAFRLAELTDLPQLLEFTQGYYTFEGIDYVEEVSTKALCQLICSEHFGRIWLILLEGRPVGYTALTFGFSLEVGGRDAFIDELFLIEAARGKGIGTRVMDFMKAEAYALGIKALHLEVGRDNGRAQRLYKTVGFQGRQNFFLMTCQTASTR
jgi:GNAT superfamily N-acetyltransferase